MTNKPGMIDLDQHRGRDRLVIFLTACGCWYFIGSAFLGWW